jgi:hypothetical protein
MPQALTGSSDDVEIVDLAPVEPLLQLAEEDLAS